MRLGPPFLRQSPLEDGWPPLNLRLLFRLYQRRKRCSSRRWHDDLTCPLVVYDQWRLPQRKRAEISSIGLQLGDFRKRLRRIADDTGCDLNRLRPTPGNVAALEDRQATSHRAGSIATCQFCSLWGRLSRLRRRGRCSSLDRLCAFNDGRGSRRSADARFAD